MDEPNDLRPHPHPFQTLLVPLQAGSFGQFLHVDKALTVDVISAEPPVRYVFPIVLIVRVSYISWMYPFPKMVMPEAMVLRNRDLNMSLIRAFLTGSRRKNPPTRGRITF